MFYRNSGFSDAQMTAKAMCNEMNTEAEPEKEKKRNFGSESQAEPIDDALMKLHPSMCLCIQPSPLLMRDFRNLEW